MTVTLEKEIAIDLVESKLSTIRKVINEIMTNWNVEEPKKLIEMARKGEIEEAEMDAITLRQLIEDQIKYENLLATFKK